MRRARTRFQVLAREIAARQKVNQIHDAYMQRWMMCCSNDDSSSHILYEYCHLIMLLYSVRIIQLDHISLGTLFSSFFSSPIRVFVCSRASRRPSSTLAAARVGAGSLKAGRRATSETYVHVAVFYWTRHVRTFWLRGRRQLVSERTWRRVGVGPEPIYLPFSFREFLSCPFCMGFP